jgi:hypothetical protein
VRKKRRKRKKKNRSPGCCNLRKDFSFFPWVYKNKDSVSQQKIKKNLPAKPFTPSWHLIGLTEPTLAMQIHWLFLQK